VALGDRVMPELAGAEADEARPSAEEPAVPVPGSLRARVVDHLVDTAEAGPQSVAMIISGVGNYSRNTVEQCLRRMRESGEIERVGPGQYVLGKPEPPADPPKPTAPAPEPPAPDPEAARLEADRERKREQRRRDAEAAAARRIEADRQLRDQLLAETNGNFNPGPDLDDVSPIRGALDQILLDVNRTDAGDQESEIVFALGVQGVTVRHHERSSTKPNTSAKAPPSAGSGSGRGGVGARRKRAIIASRFSVKRAADGVGDVYTILFVDTGRRCYRCGCGVLVDTVLAHIADLRLRAHLAELLTGNRS
jgi:hypothetical protein